LWFLAAEMTVLLHRSAIVKHLRAAAGRTPIDNIVRPSPIYQDHHA
jgi:hypothetical protein